jgi:protein involved in ribonucleotide reduction
MKLQSFLEKLDEKNEMISNRIQENEYAWKQQYELLQITFTSEIGQKGDSITSSLQEMLQTEMNTMNNHFSKAI